MGPYFQAKNSSSIFWNARKFGHCVCPLDILIRFIIFLICYEIDSSVNDKTSRQTRTEIDKLVEYSNIYEIMSIVIGYNAS